MDIQIKTLTPLWTGGVEPGKMDRIHETGILGSLRWWYEAIVRGMGGKVCDPTGDTSCILSGENLKRYYNLLADGIGWREALTEVGICEACQVFGCTGWKRRFRLNIFETAICDVTLNDVRINRNNHTSTWYFKNPAKEGSFCIVIQSLSDDFEPEIIGSLLQFISDWVAFGAKNQMGLGVIQPENERIDTQPLYDWFTIIPNRHCYPKHPNMKDMFFACVEHESASVQNTFNLKYDLRQCFAGQQNTDLRHFIMGTVKGSRIAAKVKMSRPFNNDLIRLWGWIPDEDDTYQNSWNHESVVNTVYQYVCSNSNYSIKIWREMNSSRDTISPNNNDPKTMLRSMLMLEGV